MIVDSEKFRKLFFELNIEFRPSQINAVFDCINNSKIADDAIIPIQCKNCISKEDIGGWQKWCNWHNLPILDDDFCSWAERKEK